MGALLKLVGLGWAVIGVVQFFNIAGSTPPVSPTTLGFTLLFNVVLFVIPGLILAGIGAIAAKKKSLPSLNRSIPSGIWISARNAHSAPR